MSAAGIWPKELQEFRERHLQSGEHIAILCIAAIEKHIETTYGYAPDATGVPYEVRGIAALLFVQSQCDVSPEQSAKIDAEILRLDSVLKGRPH